MNSISDEQFLVVRGLIALSSVDGRFSDTERAVIDTRLSNYELTEAQRGQIDEDIESPPNPLEIYGQLKSSKEKGWFVTSARVLFHADGEFCAGEQEVFEALEKLHSSEVATAVSTLQMDLKVVQADVDKRLEEIEKNRTKFLGGIFDGLLEWVLKKF